MTFEEMLYNMVTMAEKEGREQQQIIDFILDKNNRNILEQIYLISTGYMGQATLSSGDEVYIHQTAGSPKDVGDAFQKISDRLYELRKLAL